MRSLLPALAAASLFVSSVASASQCAKPADKLAFDLAGLKSELMVVAISCGQQANYNAFVTRYRPSLVSEEQGLNSYFRRAFGRSAQKQHDDYITLLANAQSDAGIKRGSFFCRENVGLFNDVLALHTGADLQSYASGKALPQPIALIDCPAPKPRLTRTARK
jgi:hypothetical protein